MNTMHWVYWVFLFLVTFSVVSILVSVGYFAVRCWRKPLPPKPPACAYCMDHGGGCMICNGW